MSSAIEDRLNISTETKTEVEVLREYLRSDPADDMIVDLIYETTKGKADDYLNNDFVDSDGLPLPIPSSIKFWVIQMVGRHYNRRANGLGSENESGLGSLTWKEEELQVLQEFRKIKWG